MLEIEIQIPATDQQKEQIQGMACSEEAHRKLELKTHISASPPESS